MSQASLIQCCLLSMTTNYYVPLDYGQQQGGFGTGHILRPHHRSHPHLRFRPILCCGKKFPHPHPQWEFNSQQGFLPTVYFSFLYDTYITIWVLNEHSRYPTTLAQLTVYKTLVSSMDHN